MAGRGDINRRGNGLWRRIVDNRESYIMLAPFLTFFTLFTVMSVVMAIFIGFTDYDMLNPPRFVGLENYLRLFLEDDVFLIALKNTLILAFVTGPVCYIICFLFAWLVNELRPLLRSFATVVFYAPVLSGQAFVIWQIIFSNDRYGIVNGILLTLGITNNEINWLADPRYMMTVIIVVQLWMSLGTGFLAFIAGLQGTDKTLFEAGAVDGIRNRFQELWFITLPQMAPQLLFGAVMQIVAAFSIAEVPMALVGFPSTEYAAETILTHIIDYGTIRFEMGFACATATVLFLMMFFSNKAVSRLLKGIGH
jgi:multiple sugar transport system permease protein